MSSFEDVRRLLEVSLFTRPEEFGGEAYKETSITDLLDQGLVTSLILRTIEVKSRTFAGRIKGLIFNGIQVMGPRKNLISLHFTYDGRPLILEAPDV